MTQLQPTLISLDNALDYLGVYDQLGSSQHALLHGIIRIFNRIKYPPSLVIANITLQTKSGIKPSSFHRTRQALLEFLIDQSNTESWIINYKDNPQQFAGRYFINYEYLLTNCPEIEQPNDNIPSTLLQPNNNLTTTYHQPNNKVAQKRAKNENDHRENKLDHTISEKKIKNDDDLRNGYLSNEIIEYSPEQLTIISLLNQKYCTTFDGGMGTKYFQYVKELSILPIEKVLDAIETSMIAKKEESLPKILPYIVAIAKNIEESSQPKEEKKIISEEKQLQNAKSKFYTQMNSINIEEFIITGESDMYPQGRLGTLKLIFNDLENNVQLYHFVKQRNPEYLEALDNMKAYMEKKEEERRQGNE